LISHTKENIERKVKELLDAGKVDVIVALDEEAYLASFRAGKEKRVLDNQELSMISRHTSKKIAENLTSSWS